jgi:hypothetical protein
MGKKRLTDLSKIMMAQEKNISYNVFDKKCKAMRTVRCPHLAPLKKKSERKPRDISKWSGNVCLQGTKAYNFEKCQDALVRAHNKSMGETNSGPWKTYHETLLSNIGKKFEKKKKVYKLKPVDDLILPIKPSICKTESNNPKCMKFYDAIQKRYKNTRSQDEIDKIIIRIQNGIGKFIVRKKPIPKPPLQNKKPLRYFQWKL